MKGTLFVADSGLDNFEHDMAGPDDLAAGLFEIDGDSVAINGLNTAEPPIGLVRVANDGARSQQEIHWVPSLQCVWDIYSWAFDIPQLFSTAGTSRCHPGNRQAAIFAGLGGLNFASAK